MMYMTYLPLSAHQGEGEWFEGGAYDIPTLVNLTGESEGGGEK
jgi:hypothetical protein